MHEVGTVVFTVSAQFGVPVTNTWASTRGITSFARRIVNPPAEVEALGHEEVSEVRYGSFGDIGATLAEVSKARSRSGASSPRPSTVAAISSKARSKSATRLATSLRLRERPSGAPA